MILNLQALAALLQLIHLGVQLVDRPLELLPDHLHLLC